MNVTYNFTGAIQFVALAQGSYTIAASGAQGGGSGRYAGGLGAIVEGNFTFQTSTQLILVVGGAGANGAPGSAANAAGGGGGGTFVFVDTDNDGALTSNDTLLLAAGGGGGGQGGISSFEAPATPGFAAAAGAEGNGLGGAGGSGYQYNGGGGAGIDSAGGDGLYANSGFGASNITSGGAGRGRASGIGGRGGYGGGGGGSWRGGGGGGGYSGGAGGSADAGGEGGRSYIDPAATSQSSTAGEQQGDGLVAITCFAAGTLIRTAHGDVAMESLAVGDRVVTVAGEHRPIRWIGHRTYSCRGRREALPVRVQAGAFGEGRPARDLYVSPAHAICVDVLGEVLIPAIRLVNGTTVTQVERDEVTYLHVELDSHDILLAEGLPAESYLDCGNRRFFANAEVTDLLAVPDARPEGPLPFCRPFHEAGPVVDLVRMRLEDRAGLLGWHKVEEAFAGLHLLADGRAIRPDVQGLTARFVVPADARNVRLVSETSVPAHVVPGSSDDRRLGVALAALTIDDGLTGACAIALDDTRLNDGFHAVVDEARWTDGSAELPADLWAGCKGSFFLRVTLAGPALARWVAPGGSAGVVSLAERRRA